MTWFKVDDGFGSHPKVGVLITGHPRDAGAALALWVLAGSWCSKHLTDGVVPATYLRHCGLRRARAAAAALVAVGLWEVADEGFRFVDWSQWQPTRWTVEQKRKGTRERVAKHRESITNRSRSDHDRITIGSKSDHFVITKCSGSCHFCGSAIDPKSIRIEHESDPKWIENLTPENAVSVCDSCSLKRKAGQLVTRYRCSCLERYTSVTEEPGNALHQNSVTLLPSRPVPTRPEDPPKAPFRPGDLSGERTATAGAAAEAQIPTAATNSGAHLAEVQAGWSEGFEQAGAGEPPALVGQPLHAAVTFARRLAARHGKPLRDVARDVACAVAALDGPRIDVWALGRVDPYTKRRKAARGQLGGFVEPSEKFARAPAENDVDASIDALFQIEASK